MSPLQAVRSVLRQSLRFSGRARRSEYWWWLLVYAGACGLASLVDPSVVVTDPGEVRRAAEQALLAAIFLPPEEPGLVYAVVFYGLLVPHVAVTVRRLHDRSYSAWWLLLVLVPFGFLALLAICARDSWVGPNRHGPDPKNRTAPAGARGPTLVPHPAASTWSPGPDRGPAQDPTLLPPPRRERDERG